MEKLDILQYPIFPLSRKWKNGIFCNTPFFTFYYLTKVLRCKWGVWKYLQFQKLTFIESQLSLYFHKKWVNFDRVTLWESHTLTKLCNNFVSVWLSHKVTLSKLTHFFVEILTLLRVNKQKCAEFYQFCITCLPKTDEI